MKIGQPSDIPVSPPSVNTSPPAKQAASTHAAAAAQSSASQSGSSASVAVSVSQQARALEKTARSEAGDVDTSKVDAVRAAIEDGSYVVDAEAIADKLLANAKEILSRQNQG